MATKRLTLQKNLKKNKFLRSYMGDETAEILKALASTNYCHLLLLHMHFGCYGNLEFP